MAKLEAQFGTTLFNRTSNGVTLTDAGRQLIPYVEDIVAAYDRMQGSLKEQPPHKIRVAYCGYIEALVLENTFLYLHQIGKPMVISPINLKEPELDKALSTQQCDVILQISGERTHFTTQNITEYHLLAGVSSISELARRQTLTVQDLKSLPIILHSINHSRNLFQWLKSKGFDEERMILANSQSEQMLMVSLNQAIGFFPSIPNPKGLNIKLLPVADLHEAFSVTATYREETEDIRAFVEAAKGAITFSWGTV